MTDARKTAEAEIERLRSDRRAAAEAHAKLEAEIERLRADYFVGQQIISDQAAQLFSTRTEVERLRAALEEIIWHDPKSPAAACARRSLDC